MTEMAKDVAAIDVTDLLTRYSFDLSDSALDRLVDTWLDRYPVRWIRLAVIEALYQGRYKAISVEQILNLWQRRGKALHHFNHEFERVICGRFPYTQFSASESRFAAARSYSKPSPQTIPQPIVPRPEQENIPSPPPPQVEKEPIVVEGASDDVDSVSAPIVSDLASSEDAAESFGEDSGSTPLQNLPTASPVSSSPVSSSPVSVFQPPDSLELEPLVTLTTSRSPLHRQPIHNFVPSSESSDFYAKLRAVAQSTPLVEADQGR